MVKKIYSSFISSSILIFIFLVLTGCKQDKIIGEEKFIDIYTSMILEKDTTSISSPNNEKLLNDILTNNNVSLEEYKSTIQYYNEDSERWEGFFVKALARLEEKKNPVK